MNSVADLVDESTIKQLSTPSNYRSGQEIAQIDGVSFTEFSPMRVAAHVSAPSTEPHDTLLEAIPAGLHWRCSCSPNKALFCEHLAATAIKTRQKAETHY